MALQQNVATDIRYVVESTFGTAPAASTAVQSIRRVSSTLALTKQTYASQEVRSDRQIADFRHGTRSVTGDITGELSPATYADFQAAWCRNTWAAVTTVTQATAGMSAATLTVASGTTITASTGSWITSGLTVGMVIRLGAGFSAGNQAKGNLRIISLTATVLTVDKTLTGEGPLSTYNISIPGKRVQVPSSGFVTPSYAIEVNYPDVDLSDLYTGCRVGRVQLNMPSSGMATTVIGFMGQDGQSLSGAAAPYFTGTVTAPTSTGILAAVNGSLVVGGVAIAVVTGMEITGDLSPSNQPVVGSNVTPEIFLGRANITGNMTALLQDNVLISDFINETEISIMLSMNVDSTAGSDFFSIVLPRVKLGSATVQRQGEGGIPVSFSFQALKKPTTAGYDATSIVFQDSLAP